MKNKTSMSKESFLEFLKKDFKNFTWTANNIIVSPSSLKEIKKDYSWDFDVKDVQSYEVFIHGDWEEEEERIEKLEVISLEKYFRIIALTNEGTVYMPDNLLDKNETKNYLKSILST